MMSLERSGARWYTLQLMTLRRSFKGALMAKVGVKAVYRMVPVHPDDRYLLGMQWNGKVYIDPSLL